MNAVMTRPKNLLMRCERAFEQGDIDIDEEGGVLVDRGFDHRLADDLAQALPRQVLAAGKEAILSALKTPY